MNWLKKNIEKLSSKLNGDEANENTVEQKVAASKDISFDNMEELKELSIGAITKAVKMLGYGNTVVSGLNFHSKFLGNAVENIALTSLIKDENFSSRMKRDFKSKGIKYEDDFAIGIIYESDKFDKITCINNGLGVEILTPTETIKKLRAEIIATEGITWDAVYILEPTGKQYFIGRCKDPKIENGPKIHNDIAFIGPEEKDDPAYKINSYVSRSHAYIIFDKTIGAYKLYRSKFLNNPSHKLKIYNTGITGFTEVSLNQYMVPHVLRDGDNITLNDKAVLAFHLLEE